MNVVKSLVIVSCLFCNCALAGASLGKVTGLLVNNQGAAIFSAGTHDNKPACATAGGWIFDSTAAAGKTIISVILSAQAQGKQVQVIGTGNCTYWGDRENISYLTVYD